MAATVAGVVAWLDLSANSPLHRSKTILQYGYRGSQLTPLASVSTEMRKLAEVVGYRDNKTELFYTDIAILNIRAYQDLATINLHPLQRIVLETGGAQVLNGSIESKDALVEAKFADKATEIELDVVKWERDRVVRLSLMTIGEAKILLKSSIPNVDPQGPLDLERFEPLLAPAASAGAPGVAAAATTPATSSSPPPLARARPSRVARAFRFTIVAYVLHLMIADYRNRTSRQQLIEVREWSTSSWQSFTSWISGLWANFVSFDWLPHRAVPFLLSAVGFAFAAYLIKWMIPKVKWLRREWQKEEVRRLRSTILAMPLLTSISSTHGHDANPQMDERLLQLVRMQTGFAATSARAPTQTSVHPDNGDHEQSASSASPQPGPRSEPSPTVE